ncbi:MAG: hypothetical protein CM15mP21_6630 [Hyphomicrobiales bacterium]|nr:MAG: hypothetical protein CM15mP21_6630 [Hyphomicrobiales bacterium]
MIRFLAEGRPRTRYCGRHGAGKCNCAALDGIIPGGPGFLKFGHAGCCPQSIGPPTPYNMIQPLELFEQGTPGLVPPRGKKGELGAAGRSA